ncbi:MAG: replication factor C large subunit [Asgard group archaeon]|nr:replication factor C large subunit [Asgard group archaeon]
MAEKTLPWTELYRPTNLGQVVGNENAVDALREWFDSWSQKAKRKVALLHGPAGTGKTSSVFALAKERGYELVEMNASDTRNKNAILRIAGSSAKEGTLTGGAKGKRILLIDEVDGITGREDRGGVKSLIDVIAEAAVPIICTANDAYNQKLKALRKVSKVIAYYPVHKESILKVLKKISREQKFELKTEALDFLAEHAQGDLRSAINDLEGTALQIKAGKTTDIELLHTYRDQTKDIQQALADLFNSQNFIEGKHAIDGVKMKYDELLLWIFENAYMHTSDKQLASTYETLASADRFLGRIMRRQNWKLLSYFFDLVSGGVAVEVDKPSKQIKQYIFPQKIGMYAQTRFSRALRDSIASSMAEKTHVSKIAARSDSMYLVKQVLNGNIGDAAQMAYWLELDDNQLKSLVENPDSIRKIKKLMKVFDEEKIKHQTSMGKQKFSSFDDTGDDWSEILEEYERKKEEQLAAEERLKEEEKKRKAEARKTKKATEKKTAKEAKKEESEKEDKKQVSLDDFF